MIIQFAVANFRCHRDEQILNLLSSRSEKRNPGATWVLPSTVSKRKRSVLKSAGIFGANASGKSNILRALYQLQLMVTGSDAHPGTLIKEGYEPFLFNDVNKREPIFFGLEFCFGGIRYQYTVEFDQTRILKEQLTAYPNERPQRWFVREYMGPSAASPYSWNFSNRFDASDDKLVNRTREEVLFLSAAGQWNHPQLRPIRDWFANYIVVSTGDIPFHAEFTLNKVENDQNKEQILHHLQRADLGITDIKTKSRDIPFRISPSVPEEVFSFLGRPFPKTVKERRTYLIHCGENGSNHALPFERESMGTQRYIGILGPILDILEHGKILVIDELETSLHPLLVHDIVRLFTAAETNPKGAQLIFTSHLTSLFSAALDNTDAAPLLRRDQIWFTEKTTEGAACIFPLTDFSPRKNEQIERGYFSGRYGGIPIIRERDNHDPFDITQSNSGTESG